MTCTQTYTHTQTCTHMTRTHIFGAVLAAGLSAGLLTFAGQGTANATPLMPLSQAQINTQGAALPLERTQFRVVAGNRHHWRGRRWHGPWHGRPGWRHHRVRRCNIVWRNHRRVRVCRWVW